MTTLQRRRLWAALCTAALLSAGIAAFTVGRGEDPVRADRAPLALATPVVAATALATLSPSVSPRPTPSSPTPAPRATARSPRPTTQASSPLRSTGDLRTVAGRSEVLGTGPLRRFKVMVERGLTVEPVSFGAQVHQTLGDPRGWGHGGRMSFQRVDSGRVAFTVVLASPATTDRMCAPLRTGGIFSCYDSRGNAVINARRWLEGANSYSGHLAEYRQYVISHEVGHALGHGHVSSCRSDGKAPTMMQQTKSLYGCKRNAWPYP